MKKLIAVAALTLAVPFASAKVLISFDGGLGYNLNSLSEESNIAGDFDLDSTDTNTGSAPYNLGMEAKGGLYGWAKISLPLLPDVKVKYESMVLDGTNSVNINVPVFGETFNMSGDVNSILDLSHLDLALTIGLPLPVVDIDLGLNARSMLGGFSATGTVGSEEETIESPFSVSEGGAPLIIPMGYLSAAATIPGVGVKVGGEISTLPLGDTNFTDWNVKGTWYAPLPTSMLVKLGVEAGYRSFNMTIGESTLGMDTSELASEVGVSGFFLGAAFHF
jgi:outer membrane protein